MLSWRNRSAQDAYTIEVTGSSPVGSTKKLVDCQNRQHIPR